METGKFELRFKNRPIPVKEAIDFAEKMLNRLDIQENQRLLEVGCGNGTVSKHIARKFGLQVTGTEIKPTQVQVARRGIKEIPNIKFVGTTATDLPFDDGYFDIILTYKVMHQVPPWLRALKEINRVLKPGGYLILGDVFYLGLSIALGKLLKTKSSFAMLSELNSFIAKSGYSLVYSSDPKSKPRNYFEAIYKYSE